jgi:hypothetical protein
MAQYSTAELRKIRRVQFGILSPEEIVSVSLFREPTVLTSSFLFYDIIIAQ